MHTTPLPSPRHPNQRVRGMGPSGTTIRGVRRDAHGRTSGQRDSRGAAELASLLQGEGPGRGPGCVRGRAFELCWSRHARALAGARLSYCTGGLGRLCRETEAKTSDDAFFSIPVVFLDFGLPWPPARPPPPVPLALIRQLPSLLYHLPPCRFSSGDFVRSCLSGRVAAGR